MTDRDEVHLLSGAYALDALDAAEAARVEAAMAESEELRHEVVGLSDTAVALGLAVSPFAPPPALRGRLLDAIDGLPQEAPDQPAAEVPVAASSGAHVAPRRRRRLLRRPGVLLAAAVAAVALFSGGFLVQRTLLEPQGTYARITTAADVQKASGNVGDGGTATVYWSKSVGRTAVVLNGVTAPSGKVLQLWSMRGRSITSEGLYEPQAGEHYEVLPGVPAAGEKLAVSIETHEAEQPSSPPIVAVPLTT